MEGSGTAEEVRLALNTLFGSKKSPPQIVDDQVDAQAVCVLEHQISFISARWARMISAHVSAEVSEVSKRSSGASGA